MTLFYAAKDERRNEAVVLLRLLKNSMLGSPLKSF